MHKCWQRHGRYKSWLKPQKLRFITLARPDSSDSWLCALVATACGSSPETWLQVQQHSTIHWAHRPGGFPLPPSCSIHLWTLRKQSLHHQRGGMGHFFPERLVSFFFFSPSANQIISQMLFRVQPHKQFSQHNWRHGSSSRPGTCLLCSREQKIGFFLTQLHPGRICPAEPHGDDINNKQKTVYMAHT